MSSPYTAEFQVFASGTNATATTALPGDGHWAGSVDLSFTGTGFSGTFDFQGRPHESAEWQNIPYAVLDDSPAVSVAQVSLTTSSATIVYTLIRPMPYMRVVMTRTAGSFKMLGRYTGNVAGLNLETVLGAGTAAIGTVDTELPAAAALTNGFANPTTTNLAAMQMQWNGATWDRAANQGALGDGVASAPWPTPASEYQYNGTSFDRARNNIDVTLLASASRTTTQTSADITTYNLSQLTVVLDMTTVGTGSVTVTINGKDAVSGKYYPLLSGAAITTNSTNVYRVGIGNTVTANVSANVMIPRTIQIVVTANNANAATYSVGYQLSV